MGKQGGERRLVGTQAGCERRLALLARVGGLVDPVPAPVAGGETVEPPQLAERIIVIVDAEVEDAVDGGLLVALARDDDEPRGLPAAVVAACRLRRIERGEQPLGERAGCRVERLTHRRPDLGRAEHVPLHAHVLRGQVAGMGDAALAGMRCGRAARIDERDLPDLAALVGLEQLVERLARALVPRPAARARAARTGAR